VITPCRRVSLRRYDFPKFSVLKHQSSSSNFSEHQRAKRKDFGAKTPKQWTISVLRSNICFGKSLWKESIICIRFPQGKHLRRKIYRPKLVLFYDTHLYASWYVHPVWKKNSGVKLTLFFTTLASVFYWLADRFFTDICTAVKSISGLFGEKEVAASTNRTSMDIIKRCMKLQYNSAQNV